ncbi:MAG: FAD-dependent oxidoreductase [Clostridia bacterium]|nr:FAD-dependent oxidoreductase [Clostridia bacterium]
MQGAALFDELPCSHARSRGDEAVFTENFDKLVHIPIDSAIIALGQGPQADYISKGEISTTERGLIAVDETGKTSKEGVFAAGDIVYGPKTVVDAVAHTKVIANAIDEYLKSL